MSEVLGESSVGDAMTLMVFHELIHAVGWLMFPLIAGAMLGIVVSASEEVKERQREERRRRLGNL